MVARIDRAASDYISAVNPRTQANSDLYHVFVLWKSIKTPSEWTRMNVDAAEKLMRVGAAGSSFPRRINERQKEQSRNETPNQLKAAIEEANINKKQTGSLNKTTALQF